MPINQQSGESPLYSMEEGDVIQFDAGVSYRYDVLRVPNGWLYTLVLTRRPEEPVCATFVPQPFFK